MPPLTTSSYSDLHTFDHFYATTSLLTCQLAYGSSQGMQAAPYTTNPGICSQGSIGRTGNADFAYAICILHRSQRKNLETRGVNPFGGTL
jgi:hypothetical protein